VALAVLAVLLVEAVLSAVLLDIRLQRQRRQWLRPNRRGHRSEAGRSGSVLRRLREGGTRRVKINVLRES